MNLRGYCAWHRVNFVVFPKELQIMDPAPGKKSAIGSGIDRAFSWDEALESSTVIFVLSHVGRTYLVPG